MRHLTDEQLSALADGAFEGGTRNAVERHLEACPECREALAGLVAQDHALHAALEHDPGEAYFESFAARVGGRVRAAGLKGAQARQSEGRGLADWFRSPRKLALVAAMATVVAGAGIVMLVTHEVQVPALREKEIQARVAQEAGPERPARLAPGQPGEPPPVSGRAPSPASPAAGESAQETARFRQESVARTQAAGAQEQTAPAPEEPAPMARAQEVRRSEAGEEVPVQRPGRFAYPPPRPVRAPAAPGEAMRVQKPQYAGPLESEKRAATLRSGPRPAPGGVEALAPSADQAAPRVQAEAVPAPRTEETPAAQRAPAAPGRVCGIVLDQAGRPIAGAQVVSRATGASVTSAADGSFCLESRGRTLPITVMAVGFKPVWRTVPAGEETPVALEAVPVMGAPRTDRVLGFAEKGRALPVRGAPDAFDDLPTYSRTHAKNAQRLTALAEKVGVAPAWDSAAAAWERVIEGVQGGPLKSETRFQVARARFMAWRADATEKRAARAVEALDAFLTHAPEEARRDTVQGWREALEK